MRLFYIPLGGTKAPAHGGANPAPAKDRVAETAPDEPIALAAVNRV